jgi:bleomycin hydrolase
MLSLLISTALQIINFNYTLLPFQLSLINNPISVLTKDNTIINQNPFLFNHEISTKLPITDQKSSGRCWIFASLNLVRIVTNQNWNEYEINDLEFSQNYIYFWDKLERYHRNLHYFVKIKDINNNDHYLNYLFKDPLGDGGQWDMAKEIIKKYGIVPKQIMPDTYHSKSSSGMNKFLTEKLKRDIIKLNQSIDYESSIENMITETYHYLVGFLGTPPLNFDYIFKSKDKIISWNNLVPLQLLELTKFNPDDWVSIVNDPRSKNPYYKYYQVEYLGNVMDQHVGWLNLPIERLIQLTKSSIDDNQPVWFGCDVGATFDRETGVHDPNIFDLKTFMSYENNMSKEERLSTFLSLPSHAMVIVGYHEDNGNIKRWKIENSWGKTSGTDGFQLMTNDWFNEYVFQIIIHKSKLFDSEKELLSTDPLIVPPWDPLGTLAKKIDNLII